MHKEERSGRTILNARNLKRLVIYFAGMWIVSLGIVLCTKCNLGVSPISNIPYLLAAILPLTFGQFTILFHFLNIALQMIIGRAYKDLKIWLQIPVAFLFGVIIDFLKGVLRFEATFLPLQLLVLALSIFFTALGMVMMLDMDLVQNPPDGTVQIISAKSGAERGKIKILYDISCALVSLLIGLLVLGKPYGIGVATVLSAIFVGRTVSLIDRVKGKLLGARRDTPDQV